ncbi:MAG: hypothetical protein U9M95_06300 [Candidatus Altiarchaeota archaeon]|nr:hypothetical protein [Candidatus Altiarchaeota archaeon]
METSYFFEVKRQLVHLIVGVCIAFGVYVLEPLVGKLIILPLMLSVTVMLALPKAGEELRVHNHLLVHFERPRDIQNLPYRGAIFYCLGITPAILLLDVNTACAVIAILSIGDSTSTMVGKKYGRHRIGHKSLEGSVAFIFFSFFGALVFLPDDPVKAAVFALLGGLTELSNIQHDHLLLDDNLLVPLFLTLAALLTHTPPFM